MRKVEGWERKGWKVKGKWEREQKVMVENRNLRIELGSELGYWDWWKAGRKGRVRI